VIPIEEAIEMIRALEPPPLTEDQRLAEAAGRVLSRAITAPEPLPRFTNSAMDGFAARWSEVEAAAGGSPCVLEVAGESRAGAPFTGTMPAGAAVRISTGAMLPDDADTIIPLEDVEDTGDRITILTVTGRNQHVRFEGEEITTGDLILEAGTRLTPASLGLLASLGIDRVAVSAPPTVGLVVTGHELVDGQGEIKAWQIRDSNALTLTAAVTNAGGVITGVTRCGDTLGETEAAINEAADGSRIVIVSGGVSVGPHDHVKEAAGNTGFDQVFWRVNQKPGKPLFFAHRGDQLFFGLPGNPVSVLNCFTCYIHPLLQRMQGRPFSWEQVEGVFDSPYVCRGDRRFFLRVSVRHDQDGAISVTPLEQQGSHMLSSMTRADGFLLLDPGDTLAIGDSVTVFLYPWRA